MLKGKYIFDFRKLEAEFKSAETIIEANKKPYTLYLIQITIFEKENKIDVVKKYEIAKRYSDFDKLN